MASREQAQLTWWPGFSIVLPTSPPDSVFVNHRTALGLPEQVLQVTVALLQGREEQMVAQGPGLHHQLWFRGVASLPSTR